MPWTRRRYRGNKVWIEAGDDGALVLDERGLARLRYKPEDTRTYSVRPSEIHAIEEEPQPFQGSEGAPGARGKKEPAPAPAPRGAEAEPAEAADDGPPGDDIPALAGLAIHAYTDGASSGNPGPAGIGVVLIFREHKREVSRYLGETTNNVAELTAILEALRLVKRRDLPVRVHADSSYAIGVLDGSMRPKLNRDLVEEIREVMRGFPDLKLVKVEGHAGVEWNERADKLATDAIKKHRRG